MDVIYTHRNVCVQGETYAKLSLVSVSQFMLQYRLCNWYVNLSFNLMLNNIFSSPLPSTKESLYLWILYLWFHLTTDVRGRPSHTLWRQGEQCSSRLQRLF